MMNLKQIFESSSALASQFRGNIPMAEAVGVMPSVQPLYAEFWQEVARSIEAGNRLSDSLPTIWPEALVSAVVAGEEAGKMESVMTRITDAVRIQLDLRKALTKMVYPAVIGLAGMTVFLGVMVFVAPKTIKSFKAVNLNLVSQLSLLLEEVVKGYWMVILAGLAAAIVAGVRWGATEEGKNTILEAMLRIPYLGPGLSQLFFGLWAQYMSLMYSAGIALDRAILLTVKVVPESLQEGFLAFERDLTIGNKPVSEAADITRLTLNDPRQEWPLFVRRALVIGDKTGAIDTELSRVSPELVLQGVEKVNRAIFFSNLMATTAAGIMVSMSFVAIYSPILSAMRQLH